LRAVGPGPDRRAGRTGARRRPAPAGPAVSSARTGGRHRRTARRGAGAVHLAAGRSPGSPGRGARAAGPRMVAARPARAAHPRLLPGRGRPGRALLAVPRGPVRTARPGRGDAVVVDARDVPVSAPAARGAPAYAELGAMSNFSFLEGASHPRELIAQARALGLAAIGLADRNTLAGVVRAHVAAREAGLRLLVGCRLAFTDGTELIVFPRDRAAYRRLCRLLSIGKTGAADGPRVEKGETRLGCDPAVAFGGGRIPAWVAARPTRVAMGGSPWAPRPGGRSRTSSPVWNSGGGPGRIGSIWPPRRGTGATTGPG